MKVQQMNIKEGMSIKELLEEMGKAGALGAGRIHRATNLMAEVMADQDTVVFLHM